MSQFIAKIALITGMAVSMTGCAQMGFVGDNLWGGTKTTENYVTKSSESQLRSAPSQHYVFESAPTPYQNVHDARRPSNKYHSNQYKAPQYQTTIRSTYHPSYRAVHKPLQAKLIPRRIVRRAKPKLQAQLQSKTYTQQKISTQNQVQNNQDISFVKIGGGSNMSDWTSCQQQSGSFYQMTQTSYRIDPNFEACMRGKGYKPESEAKAELNL